jgi:hypothetical protein
MIMPAPSSPPTSITAGRLLADRCHWADANCDEASKQLQRTLDITVEDLPWRQL